VGYDVRIARAMLKLGYRIFPFEAFDGSGNLKTSVNFPPDVDAGLGRIVSNPLWADLYRTLSPLGAEGVYMAGIGFLNDRVQVALFRSTTSVPDARSAMNWSAAYHGTVEATLHGYAGRAYVLDPALRKVVDKARGYLPPSGQGVLDPDAAGDGFGDGDGDGTVQTEAADAPAAEKPVPATGVSWLGLGLDLLAELLVNVSVRTKVLTTVCWYPPRVADRDFAARWQPIHATNLQTGVVSGHRSAHLIWNPVGMPVTWRGTGVSWRGPGLDMPAEPAQWCQALRPLANCLNTPLAEPAAVEAEVAV